MISLKRHRIYLVSIIIAVILIGSLTTYYLIYLSPGTMAVGKDYIKIGFTVALSGTGAPAGTEQLRAYEICADWINAQGGLYLRDYGRRIPIKLVYYDDGSDPAKARSLYEKLIVEDKVDLLWAPWGTFIGLAVVPVLDKYNIPVILNTHTVSEDTIRKLGTKNIFVTFSDHESIGMFFALFAKKLLSDHPELRRIAIIYAETDMSVGHATWTKKVLEDQRIGEIVFYGSYPVGATDVRGLLLRVKESKPDILIAHTYAGDTLVVFPQIREVGLTPKVLILGGVGSTTSAFYTRFDNRTKEGIITWSNWHPDMHPVLKEFFNRYVGKYGYTPMNVQLGAVFVSCFVFKEAVEKAGSLDYNKIRDVLSRERFNTPFGTIWFENQIMASPWVIFIQYRDGIAQPIYMVSGKYPNAKPVESPILAQYLYPFPGWG
jgi:branched-chain amino acid transport system substrate-binding protein